MRIARKPLLSLLTQIARVTGRKATMSILGHIRLRATERGLTLEATDLQVSAVATIAAVAPGAPGAGAWSVCAPAGALVAAVKAGAADEINLSCEGPRVLVLEADGQKQNLCGLADKDWPALHPAGPARPLDADTLRDLLDATLPCVSTDETRYHLNAICVECDGRTLRMVATDGYRLARIDRPAAGQPAFRGQRLLTRRMAQLVCQTLGKRGSPDVAVHFGDETIRGQRIATVAIGDVTYTGALGEAQFPSYDQVIPKDHQHSAVIGAATLRSALEHVAAFAADKCCCVALGFAGGTLRIRRADPDLGETVRDLPLLTGSSGRVGIGVNARYLIDACKAAGDGEAFVVGLNGELDALSLVAGELHVVVMPMRVGIGPECFAVPADEEASAKAAA